MIVEEKQDNGVDLQAGDLLATALISDAVEDGGGGRYEECQWLRLAASALMM